MFTKRSKAPVQETPRPPVRAGGASGVRKRAVRAWDWSNERVKDTLHSMAFLGPSVTTGAVFINNRVGFLTIRDSERPEVWRTGDGGQTWERQNLPEAPEYYCMAYAPEEKDGILYLYVGMEEYSEYGGAKARYESKDEGRTWEYKGIVIRK